MPETVPVNVGEARGAFKASSVDILVLLQVLPVSVTLSSIGAPEAPASPFGPCVVTSTIFVTFWITVTVSVIG
jgi:hypothetical protein